MPTPDEPAGRHRLLAAQEGIWTGQQIDPDSPAYNTAEYVRIAGPVDAAVMDRALHQVVAETEALNVTFAADGQGRPYQVTVPAGDWRVHVADLTAEPDPHTAALEWMARDMARPVDLGRGPVFGHALLRTASDRFLWYHRVHHIALDGFGLSLVAQRVAEVYTALLDDRPVKDSGFGTLESVRAEEDAYRGSPQWAQDRGYWTGRFADRPPVAALSGRSALPARTFRRLVADLGTAETKALRQVARDLSVTWSDVILAIVVAYLSRATGEAEIVLSVPVMGRLGSVSLRVPSTVRNILPLRVRVLPRDNLRDLATRVSAELRAARPHQRYRYEHLRRDLKLLGGQRRLSGPGVNIMPFAYDLRFAGHRSTVHNVSAGPVDDLSVNVYDRAEHAGLRIAVDAHPGLYDDADLARHQQGLLTLLRDAVAAPGRSMDEPQAADRVTVLDGGPLPVPTRPVLSLIADHTARHPAAVAVEHDGRTISYAGLLRAATDLAHRIAARQIGPGDLVAVALPRGIDAVTAILGVLLSGAAYCPLDPAAPPARTGALLTDARPALVLTCAEHSDAFPGHAVLVLDLPDSGERTRPQRPAAEWDAAYMIYTSGSTGQPKGVEISHGALAHFVAGATHRYGLHGKDRVLQFAPLHFDASVEEIFLTLCAGATLVVRTEDMTQSVPGLLAACDRLDVSVLDLPTAYWHELAYALSTGTAELPSGVRSVIIGGEAALPERVDRWRTAVGTSVNLYNTYGPTEATVVATVADLHDPALAPGDVPIGRPLPGTRAAVVDGELHLLGAALATGYRGARNPDQSRFAPLRLLPGSPRAYRTGDLVSLGEDGQLRFTGRTDAEFKISGHRVHPAEVETVLLTHPGVREAAVVGQVLPDGTRRMVAHIVPAGPAPSATEIRVHLRAKLPAAMVPSTVELHDQLARTDSGKIDRNALSTLTTRAATPSPSASGSMLERVITGLWQQILGADHIAPDDDVFDLGAQSLQAIQAANRLGVALQRDIRVAWLFQYPTATQLAGHLQQNTQEPAVAPGLPAAVLTDAVLDAAIRPGPTAGRPTGTPPSRILLTGATGFVGAHLLAALLTTTEAEIVCPVRAAHPDEATARIGTALQTQRIKLPAAAAGRIRAIPADLARPRLGIDPDLFTELARTCDAIFHNAATVSIMRDYGSLRGANTESTRDLLRMAAARSIPLHLVSTLSVAPPAGLAPEVSEAFFPSHPGLLSGYQQSKWAGERLVEQAAERGLPVTVHRLGRVVGSAATGYVNERDFLWSVLRAGIPAGILPDLFEAETWTPVDYVAQAVVHLSLTQHPAPHTVFNHAPAPAVSLADVYAWVRAYGYPVRTMPLAQWRTALPRSADVAATTLAFFDGADVGGTDGTAEPELNLGRVRADHVVDGLRGSGIQCPPLDRDLFFRYLDHCVSTGALPAPAAAPAGSSIGSK